MAPSRAQGCGVREAVSAEPELELRSQIDAFQAGQGGVVLMILAAMCPQSLTDWR